MPMMLGAFLNPLLSGGREDWAKDFFESLMEGRVEEMNRMAEEAERERLWPDDIGREFRKLAQERARMDEEDAAAKEDEKRLNPPRREEREEEIIKRSIELAHRVLGYIPWILVGERMLPHLTKEQRAVVELHEVQAAAEAETEVRPAPEEAVVATPAEPVVPEPVPVETAAQPEVEDRAVEPTPTEDKKEETVPEEPTPRAPVEGERLATPEPDME